MPAFDGIRGRNTGTADESLIQTWQFLVLLSPHRLDFTNAVCAEYVLTTRCTQKVKLMRNDLTDITMVVDRSGSMGATVVAKS